jgi:hypothetical protein
MSNLTYLRDWRPELCIQLNTHSNHIADFNRFLVNGLPGTKTIQQEKTLRNANQEPFVLKLCARFQESINEGSSHETLYNLYLATFQYLRWCNQATIDAFTQSSLESYMNTVYQQVLLGQLKKSSYQKKRSLLISVFTRYLDLPPNWFSSIIVLSRNDIEPIEAYTRSDLNQLLPFLRSLFNQTYLQFIEDPNKHTKGYNHDPTMIFKWQGQDYPLNAGISKMMCAATYLLAYYTYANTSNLLELKLPKNASSSVSEAWYTMPVFKRRAFKTIRIEIGEHDIVEIPKYAMSFFDKLLKASQIISSVDDALLLKTITNHKIKPIKATTLQSFLKIWTEKHFTFIDQTGRRLRPIVGRFRETGSQLTAYHQGEMANDVMLNNTPNTRKQHYSKGNKYANNGMMQDAMEIRQEQVQTKVTAKEAQQNLGINVLVIEQEYKVNIPALSRTPNGGSCANPFGEKSKKYTQKAQNQQLLKQGEKLACADLLKCFGCPEQVIVQSVSDIWCLLSFKACIEESLYLHLNAYHYHKNFETVIQFIEQKILPNLKKSVLKQAKSKLDDDGLHPLWGDNSLIFGLIPNHDHKVQ